MLATYVLSISLSYRKIDRNIQVKTCRRYFDRKKWHILIRSSKSNTCVQLSLVCNYTSYTFGLEMSIDVASVVRIKFPGNYDIYI